MVGKTIQKEASVGTKRERHGASPEGVIVRGLRTTVQEPSEKDCIFGEHSGDVYLIGKAAAEGAILDE